MVDESHPRPWGDALKFPHLAAGSANYGVADRQEVEAVRAAAWPAGVIRATKTTRGPGKGTPSPFLLLGGTGEEGQPGPVGKPSSPIAEAHRYSGTRGIGRRMHGPALGRAAELVTA